MSEDLEARNAELEAEVKRLRTENELFRTEHKIAGGFATLVLAGPSLVNAFRKWFHIVKREKEAPVEESADLAAAVTRRLINAGIIGLFFASILPAGLLLWQNTLIRSQNQYFREQIGVMQKQNEYFQEQNKVILDDSTRARRAQLIATIYDEKDCGEKDCPPKAHIRSRVEALLVLNEIDRGLGRKPSFAEAKLQGAFLAEAYLADEVSLRHSDLQGANLRKADLRGADLADANLQGADLYGAHLSRANLLRANMEGADLYEANLLWANLQRANLRETNLRRASLEGAFLRWANLQEADLREVNLRQAELQGANLRGADLREVEIDTRGRLEEAIIDEKTMLPDYLEEHRDELLESSKRNLEELERQRAESANQKRKVPPM
jgi:hypothetical protein